MKKNKKEIVKRQAKAREKARKKRQVRPVMPPPRFMERPPISQMDAPKGFMTVSSSQAMMEYAKPLMEINAENLDELNRRMEAELSIYGQEKVAETVRLGKMNLAVHGLAGDIRQGNAYYGAGRSIYAAA